MESEINTGTGNLCSIVTVIFRLAAAPPRRPAAVDHLVNQSGVNFWLHRFLMPELQPEARLQQLRVMQLKIQVRVGHVHWQRCHSLSTTTVQVVIMTRMQQAWGNV